MFYEEKYPKEIIYLWNEIHTYLPFPFSGNPASSQYLNQYIIELLARFVPCTSFLILSL